MFDLKILCFGGALHRKSVDDKGESFIYNGLKYRKIEDQVDQKYPVYVCENISDADLHKFNQDISDLKKGYV